ncbi:pyridoxal phosphate-dependent aminotransferase [Cellulophaga sp. HaHa_2_1]|uniref:pyridoxal phosphate-dependent aminotransferase n=1 Tax=Cellulophaga sp. HaHa_2_1 TaxID=2749994 RepID=UPI001C4E66E8|nr:pyridoxal phosphate-dependent aminotransferase [Cellulophaga sp. HaHa_2_1]QXP51807.1 pyridoxal phosphate-dependent aminotransferase [Cellulophaga sp. HaHa_2_1]
MPTISNKGLSMPESPIRKLVPFAEAAKKRGMNVIHLNIGQPDIKTPQIALDAVKENSITTLSYSKTEGSDSYRTKLATYYLKHGIDITSEDILVTTGASEGLSFVIGSIADADDEIIVPEPFYANYNSFSIAFGVNVVPIVSKIETGFALPSIADFENAITVKTKAILICNPNNPTGYLYSEEEIKQLAQLVKKHDLFFIVDEVYREFVYDGKLHYSALREKNIDDHCIVIDSVSKRYSMCGARIGFVITKNKTLKNTILKFMQARLSPPSYAQIASEAALDTPQEYFDEVIAEYVLRRDTLVQGLNKISGIKVISPQGAFYCIVELPIKDSDTFAQWMLEHFNIDNETVMVAPAAGFYATKGLGKNQIRIAYVLDQETLKRAIHILEQALKEYRLNED